VSVSPAFDVLATGTFLKKKFFGLMDNAILEELQKPFLNKRYAC